MSTEIRVRLHYVMTERKISLTKLANRVGLTLANLSILKTNRARAIRFSTLAALCRELNCQPGDLIEFSVDGLAAPPGPVPSRADTPAPSNDTTDRSSSGLPGDYY